MQGICQSEVRCRLARSLLRSINPSLPPLSWSPQFYPFSIIGNWVVFVPGKATLSSADLLHMELHCMAKQVLIIALCLLLVASTSQARWGARSGGEKHPDDVVHEVTVATFNSTLAAAPATWAMVEFYAHWCGACKNYKPHYEKVAQLFNGPNAVHTGEVYLAKVDCADQINQELCARFAVKYYPTLLWAAPPILASGDRIAKGEELVEVTNVYSAEKLLDWINKQLAKTYSFSDVTAQGAALSAGSHSTDTVQAVPSVHDTEEATATAFKIMLIERLLTSKSRGPFIQFLQLLVVHHPSKRCRKGTADLLVNLADLWPVGEPSALALQSHQICGDSSPGNFWVDTYVPFKLYMPPLVTCRGDKRGYNCGLWLLFHSLSVRVSDKESKVAFHAIHGFVENFFNCEECREHFLKMSSSVMDSINTRRELVMWLWQAHNEVNQRLAKEGDLGIPDSKPERAVWPSRQLCSTCISSTQEQTTQGTDTEWDYDAVYSFVTNWYGPSLQPLPKKKSTLVNLRESVKGSKGVDCRSGSAAVKGAVFGVFMETCGLALIAWWWRKQQKKRKY